MDITEPTVSEILGRAMVARIATVSKHGRPHVNPLYFVVVDGHIHLGTATSTLASHNVGACPAVQVLFEIEAEPDDRRVLRLDGTAVVRTEPALIKQYRTGVAHKYVITPRGLWNMLVHPRQWRPMRRHLAGGAGCVLDVTPTSWELFLGAQRTKELRSSDSAEFP